MYPAPVYPADSPPAALRALSVVLEALSKAISASASDSDSDGDAALRKGLFDLWIPLFRLLDHIPDASSSAFKDNLLDLYDFIYSPTSTTPLKTISPTLSDISAALRSARPRQSTSTAEAIPRGVTLMPAINPIRIIPPGVQDPEPYELAHELRRSQFLAEQAEYEAQNDDEGEYDDDEGEYDDDEGEYFDNGLY